MASKKSIHDMFAGALTSTFSTAMAAAAPLLGYAPHDAKFATEKGMEYVDMAVTQKAYKFKNQAPR